MSFLAWDLDHVMDVIPLIGIRKKYLSVLDGIR